jgi:hypothetical protein
MSDLDALAKKYGGQAVDLDALSQQYGGESSQPSGSTASGVTGGIARGLAPVAGGAAFGAAMGAPLGGIGAIPGAMAGAAAGGLAGPIGDPIVSLINRVAGTRFGLPSQAIQDLLTRAGVAKPFTPMEKMAEAGAAGIGGAGGMVALGRNMATAASPVIAGAGNMLASNAGAQLMGGAAASGASQMVANEGGSIPVQLLAGVAGGMAGTRLASPKLPIVQTKVPEIIQQAEQAKIPVYTSDVNPPTTWLGKFFRARFEQLPFIGAGPLRAEQQAARVGAVQRMIDDYAVQAPNIEKTVMDDLLKKRGDMLTKYTGYKTDVVGKLDNIPVGVTRTTNAIDNEIANLAKLNNPDVNKLIHVLEGWKGSLQNQTLGNVEKNRRLISEQFKSPDLASISSEGEKIVRRVYAPLRADILDFVKENGTKQDATKWAVANARLAESARELEKTAFKSALDSGKITPEAFKPLLFSSKPSDVAILYKSLSPEGRKAAKQMVIANAVEDFKILSPDRFANNLARATPSIRGMFEGAERARIEGLLTVLNHTKQGANASAAPSTGAQAVPFVGGAFLADMLGGAGVATGAAAGAGALFRVYESAPVRNLLIKIGQAKKGSATEQRLLNKANAIMQTQLEEN